MQRSAFYRDVPGTAGQWLVGRANSSFERFVHTVQRQHEDVHGGTGEWKIWSPYTFICIHRLVPGVQVLFEVTPAGRLVPEYSAEAFDLDPLLLDAVTIDGHPRKTVGLMFMCGVGGQGDWDGPCSRQSVAFWVIDRRPRTCRLLSRANSSCTCCSALPFEKRCARPPLACGLAATELSPFCSTWLAGADP